MVDPLAQARTVGTRHEGDRSDRQSQHHDHQQEEDLGGETQAGQCGLGHLGAPDHGGVHRQGQDIQDVDTDDGPGQ